jgi:hypothetical protein
MPTTRKDGKNLLEGDAMGRIQHTGKRCSSVIARRNLLRAFGGLSFFLATVAQAAILPPGFTETQFGGSGTNMAYPTAMAFAPDGRLFVCTQPGSLRIIKNGVLLDAPFLTVPVDFRGERGLLGVAFDPNFESNQFVYIYYTTATLPIHNRMSRFTAAGDAAGPGSEVVILELDDLSTATNYNGVCDRDGISDPAVWRPETGVWFVLPSNSPGSYIATQWGLPSDIPVSP